MATKFELATGFTIPAEGGYVNDPRDPGGETNFGISKRKYPAIEIKNLTLSDALAIYRRDYWDLFGCDRYRSPFCVALFDSYVNHSPQAVKVMLQFATVQDIEPDEYPYKWTRLITARRDYYGNLIQKNPDLQKFLVGWTIRLNNLSKYCGELEQNFGVVS